MVEQLKKRPLITAPHGGTNYFYIALLMCGIGKTCNLILSDFFTVFDSIRLQHTTKVDLLEQLMLSGHESVHEVGNDGYLLHVPFENVFGAYSKKDMINTNIWKLWYFDRLLVHYKKYRIEDRLDCSLKGATGLPLDASCSTPLQYAWLQDYLRISRDCSIDEDDWMDEAVSPQSEDKIKFFENQDDFEKSLTNGTIRILRNVGISEMAIQSELEGAFGFIRCKEDIGPRPIAAMQQQFREYIQGQLSLRSEDK